MKPHVTFRQPLAALLAAICTAPAVAQTITEKGPMPDDPLMALAEQYQAPNQFTLNSSLDMDLVRFKREHMITICAPRPNPGVDIDAAARGVGIILTWEGDSQTVTPGNCFTLEARKLTVRPAGAMPSNTVLVGTIRVAP
jgi:hypothetical protein